MKMDMLSKQIQCGFQIECGTLLMILQLPNSDGSVFLQYFSPFL